MTGATRITPPVGAEPYKEYVGAIIRVPGKDGWVKLRWFGMHCLVSSRRQATRFVATDWAMAWAEEHLRKEDFDVYEIAQTTALERTRSVITHRHRDPDRTSPQ